MQGAVISIGASATDLDGTITLVEFYSGTLKIGEDDTAPYTFDWSGAPVGQHDLTAVATDSAGSQTTSTVSTVTVSALMSCSEISNVAQQGSFSTGYEATFETVGNTVTVTFELLDTDKVGVVAYLWQQSPFAETPMDNTSGLTFTKTLSGQTPGNTISYAVKFAYAGGLSVTKYISYVVGSDCGGSGDDLTAPENFTAVAGTVTSTSVQLLLNGTDDSGTVVYDIVYGSNASSVSGPSGVQQSVVINNLTPGTAYTFSISASDASGNEAANNALVVQATTAPDSTTACSGTSSIAQQGSFSTGYAYTFATSGTDVTITFELLDTDKTGVVAYLWSQSPFSETPMSNTSGLTFSKTISGQSQGATIQYAVKFAFAGGLAVTQYISYVVGDNCDGGGDDTEVPLNFSAVGGTITANSIELLLNATDDSGTVLYDVSYGSENVSVSGESGVQKSLIINNLDPETIYAFSIMASDAAGNEALNNAIELQLQTLADTNTDCSGSSSEAQQGSFTTGYNYSFETVGNDVTITFELLDTDKVGVVAYLWHESPFAESPMTNTSGLVFSKTVSGLTPGDEISYGVKFAYAGGLAVTSYFNYTVGDNCDLAINPPALQTAVEIYPNPASDVLYIKSGDLLITKTEIYSALGEKLMESGSDVMNINGLAAGLYLVRVYSGSSSVVRKLLVK